MAKSPLATMMSNAVAPLPGVKMRPPVPGMGDGTTPLPAKKPLPGKSPPPQPKPGGGGKRPPPSGGGGRGNLANFKGKMAPPFGGGKKGAY